MKVIFIGLPLALLMGIFISPELSIFTLLLYFVLRSYLTSGQNNCRIEITKDMLQVFENEQPTTFYGNITYTAEEKKVGQTTPYRQVKLWAAVDGQKIPLIYTSRFGADKTIFDDVLLQIQQL